MLDNVPMAQKLVEYFCQRMEGRSMKQDKKDLQTELTDLRKQISSVDPNNKWAFCPPELQKLLSKHHKKQYFSKEELEAHEVILDHTTLRNNKPSE